MAGLDAFGTALQRSDMASSPTFTEIANVSTISGPSISRNTYDVTSHDQTDAYMEFIGGLKDAGEVSLELNWDPATEATHDDSTGLLADLEDTDPRDYKLVFPDGTTEWAFSAILTSFEPDHPVDGKITASATFKLSGKPTLTTS